MNRQASTIAAAGSAQVVGVGDARLLRIALKLDAVASGACAVAYTAGAPLVDGPLGMPSSFLIPLGAVIAVWAGFVWWLSTRPVIRPAAAWAVVALNAVWVVDSLLLAAVDGFSPTAGGTIWIVLQAALVGALAVLQYVGLRPGETG